MVSNFLTVSDVYTIALFSVPAMDDDELVTETILKNTDMLPSDEKMNGGVDGERKGRCVCLSVCTHAICTNQFLSGVHLVFTSTFGTLTDSQTHIHIHARVIYSPVYCTVCACKYVHVVVIDYRVEARRESTSASLINQKHHSGSAPVSDC